jgi:DNA-binding PucR family transcriptional regulator
VAARLPAGALAARLDGEGAAVLADPDGPGRRDELERALAKRGPVAIGPTGPVAALPASWALARAALRALEGGALPDHDLVRADDALVDVLLFENGPLIERIAARRLAPLADLTPKARARMEETALAYVRRQGNAAAMAEELGLHPQTVRYRLSRLRELLGDQLDDPDARLELELALARR